MHKMVNGKKIELTEFEKSLIKNEEELNEIKLKLRTEKQNERINLKKMAIRKITMIAKLSDQERDALFGKD